MPGSLGFLTSAYFLAFGVMQIPGRHAARPLRSAARRAGAAGAGSVGGAAVRARRRSRRASTFARAIIGARRLRLPDGAAEGHRDVVSARAAGVAVGMDHGGRRHGRAGRDGAARARAARHELAHDLRRCCAIATLAVAVLDRMARARHAATGAAHATFAHSSPACARCSASALLVDRAARRASAWARSWRSRACGRCRG